MGGAEALSEFFAQEEANGHCFCVECAGMHRGLGVHVSFVRSVSMDRWNSGQLRLMQLGGNARFKDFLATYPGLQKPSLPDRDALVALRQLYSSRAVAFYRTRLAAECAGQPLTGE